MKKTLVLLTIIGTAAMLTGCSTVDKNVPSSDLQGQLAGEPFHLRFAKNMSADEISVTVTSNRTVGVMIKNIKTQNDAGVIQMTTQGYAEMRKADGQLAKDAIGAVADAAKAVKP